jgi:hypothetical protein
MRSAIFERALDEARSFAEESGDRRKKCQSRHVELPPFAERNVMEYPGLEFPAQSGLMPANLATLPHFSVSSA